MVEDARGRRLYICLRCGNKFWSRAKKPQCSVCKSKRVIPYEEFMKLPEEERNKILGKKSEEKGEQEVKDITARVEEGEVKEKLGESEEVEQVEEEREEVKKEESPKIPEVRREEKNEEKVKGERVKPAKKGFSIPKPKLSWKAYALILGVAFLYYLYKIGWFEEMFNQFRRLGAMKDIPESGEDKPVKPYSPVLGKIEKNLGG